MNLTLSEDQQAIADLAGTILRDKLSHERLAALEGRGEWFDPGAWRALAEASLLGVPLAEDVGGGGFGILEACLVLEQIGATAAPLPWLASIAMAAMAVDRFGFAWVVYEDGSLWKVDTKDARCAATTFVPDQEGFHRFGMGFSTDATSGSAESLFVADHDGKGLGKIDLKTMKLKAIGSFDGILTGRAAELTGTGDGRLFGFFTTSPAQVGELAKGTGSAVTHDELATVSTGTDWAFSFWGGDFYLYTANDTGGLPQNQKGSSVTRFRPSDNSVTVVLPTIGFNIVGAGVSTCAPTTAPPPK